LLCKGGKWLKKEQKGNKRCSLDRRMVFGQLQRERDFVFKVLIIKIFGNKYISKN